MALSPDEFFTVATRNVDAEGRAPLPDTSEWETFPFEREGLRAVALRPSRLPEEPRFGAGGVDCAHCTSDAGVVWSNDHWRLMVFEPSGAPLVMLLSPRAHFDLGDLPEERASELGQLIVHIVRAIEGLDHVARAHVARWGDGGEHLHVFFTARPEGFEQLRGTLLALWDDLLAPTSQEVRDADVLEVARNLVEHVGGVAYPSAGVS